MGIDTDLSVPPYHNDYNEQKNFYGVLFKPEVSVQTRELNQLQTILQKQIERFGDAVFRRGTIVSGCNFIFQKAYPYAKLQDQTIDGDQAVVSQYPGLFATNQDNLRAFIVDYVDGFEASSPDLRSIYLQYINSGVSNNDIAFSPSDTLTITDANTSIFSVKIDNAGLGFSNADQIVVTPRLVVNVSTGSFTNAEYVGQPDLSSNLQIIDIDASTLANSGQVIITVRPRGVDLANSLASSSLWSVANNATIRNVGNTAVGKVEAIIGGGASGGVLTDSAGRLTNIVLTNNGYGYSNTPHVSVRSPNNLSGINSIVLVPRNYVAKVKVANTVTSVGNGYAFAISEGVVYQKGYFLRVDAQRVIVSKYNQSPNNVVVGFDTIEEIIDHNIDTSLKDNVTGDNALAPGADRLKLTPVLVVSDKDAVSSNDNFFTLVEWVDGAPFRQNQSTQYSSLGDTMAQRTKESEGDFVTDPFWITTRSPSNTSLEGTRIDIIADPGTAYISGYRVETKQNAIIPVSKGTDAFPINGQSVPLYYGNYIKIKNIGGVFQFSTGDIVELYDTAKGFLSNTTNYNTQSFTGAGNKIGEARIRSLVWDTGSPGSKDTVYKLYLFDVRMNPSKNFRDVRSVRYNGTTYKGIADAVLEYDASLNANVAVLSDAANNGLLFFSGHASLKNANNATYTYRAMYQDVTFANTGILTKSISALTNHTFPFTSSLTNDQMREIYVIPTGGEMRSTTSLGTSVSVSSTSPNVIGTGTTFLSSLRAGDYIYASGNSTENVIRRVESVVNNTLIILDANGAFTNASANVIVRTFPNSVPIPVGHRDGITANVNLAQDQLTINLGTTIDKGTSTTATIAVDVKVNNTLPLAKSASRDRYVKLRLANNEGGTTGPWCLGLPDIFRLKGVYLGTSSGVSESDRNVTDEFLVDINQNLDYYDLGWLVKRPNSRISLTSSDWLLVKFDHFNNSGTGLYCTPSYVSANSEQVANVDSQPLSSLGSSINTLEIPQVFSSRGESYDLIQYYDFRPAVVNTAVSTTTIGSANVNPANTISFGTTSDPANIIRFPNPESVMTVDSEGYLGRVDSLFVDKNGKFFSITGAPTLTPTRFVEPPQPSDTMRLNSIYIPPYPSLPEYPSPRLGEILRMRRINEKGENERIQFYTSKNLFNDLQTQQNQPQAMTHKEIGKLKRRIDNLEYYVSLSLLETEIKDRVIPSSVDPSINRFKFGFFVDDYSSTQYLETDNPQHNASILKNALVPGMTSWPVFHVGGAPAPYLEWKVVEQTMATGLPVCTPVIVGAPKSTLLMKETPTGRFRTSYEDYKFFVATPQTIDIYISGREFSIKVYRRLSDATSWTLLYDQDDLAQLTSTDKAYLTSYTFPERWFSRETFVDNSVSGDFATGSGRISVSHTAAAGVVYEYFVQVARKTAYNTYRGAIDWSPPAESVVCNIVPTPIPDMMPIGVFVGTMNSVGGHRKWFNSTWRMQAHSLRPFTEHSLLFGQFGFNKELANWVCPIGGRPGDPLITDAFGRIEFQLLYGWERFISRMTGVHLLDLVYRKVPQWNLWSPSSWTGVSIVDSLNDGLPAMVFDQPMIVGYDQPIILNGVGSPLIDPPYPTLL